MRNFLFLPIVFIFSLLAPAANAKEVIKPAAEVDDTDAILKKAFAKSMFGTSQGSATINMTIISPEGHKKERVLLFKALSEAENQLQYLIKFDKPAELKGTAFLVKERKGQLPDQYVYIPAAKTVRRIAAGNATSSFFGSDFIYADMLPYPTDKKDEVSIKKLPDQQLGGQAVYVIEVTPKMAESPYGKLLIYIEKAKVIASKIDFFDKSNQPLKTLKIRKLKIIEGKLVPVDLEMKNLQTKSSTIITVDNIDSKAKLSANDFTEAAMQR